MDIEKAIEVLVDLKLSVVNHSKGLDDVEIERSFDRELKDEEIIF